MRHTMKVGRLLAVLLSLLLLDGRDVLLVGLVRLVGEVVSLAEGVEEVGHVELVPAGELEGGLPGGLGARAFADLGGDADVGEGLDGLVHGGLLLGADVLGGICNDPTDQIERALVRTSHGYSEPRH